MSVHSGAPTDEEVGFVSPQYFANTGERYDTQAASTTTQEVHIPIDTVNFHERVNPNYIPEHFVNSGLTVGQPSNPTVSSSVHLREGHNALTRPTAAISYPIAHTGDRAPFPQKPYARELFDHESTHYNLFEPKVRPSTIAPQCSSANVYYKTLNLTSLNLKFTGESDVDEFLLRVDETRLARQIDDATLVRGFSELLSGSALKFHRTVRHRLRSWEDICGEFKKYFQAKDYGYDIERQIRERKQHVGQSVSFFVLDVQDLNSRLDVPISQANLLEIVKHNLLSSYAQLLAINDVTSFDQLINISKNFEAYSGVLSQPKPCNRREINAVASAETVPQQSQRLTCLKCKKIGHSYKVCRSIPGLICFKCGAKGVTARNCSACNKDSHVSSTFSPKQKN